MKIWNSECDSVDMASVSLGSWPCICLDSDMTVALKGWEAVSNKSDAEFHIFARYLEPGKQNTHQRIQGDSSRHPHWNSLLTFEHEYFHINQTIIQYAYMHPSGTAYHIRLERVQCATHISS